MACKVAPAFWAVLIIGITAVVLHSVGFTTTGWLVLSRKFTVEEIKITSNMVIAEAFRMEESESESESDSHDMDGRMLIDNGGMRPPLRGDEDDMLGPHPEGEDGDRHGPHRRPHPDPHHGRGRHGDRPHHHQEVIEETTEIQEWMKESVVAIEHVYMKLKFGLWHSKLCMSAKMENMEKEDDIDMDSKDDSSSSSSSSEEGHHKKKCHCKKISTQCALALSPMFLDMKEVSEIEAEENKPWYKFNYKTFLGHTCLTEHRVLTSIGLALLVIAVLTGLMAFRKMDACRCWATTCLVCLLVAFVMISIPVFRVLRYNYHEVKEKMTTAQLHAPFSWIASLLSLVMAAVLALVVALAICRRQRMSGKWKRFDNDGDSLSEKKSGLPPSLVFVPEALDGKPGLYDIWGDVKPVEVVEPEKKPLE